MVGGRLGYVLFYDLGSYLQDPLSILAIWQGGMSFHGGFIGVVLAVWYVCRKRRWNFWEIGDLVAVAVPIGLGLGRLGNFINGELYGRPTSLPWAMVFPEGGNIPRHPSQLYEAFLEGVVLFLILRWLYLKKFYPGTVFWGLDRLLRIVPISCGVRPRARCAYRARSWTLYRGQLLTLPMLVIGLTMMIIYARRNPPRKSHPSSKSRAR